MAKKPKVTLIALASLVAATQSATGFMFASPEAVKPLIDAGHAEQNTGVINPDNAAEFGTRATAEGIKHHMTNTDNAPAAAASDKPTFVRAVIDAPIKTRAPGGGGSAKYPFDDLVAPVKVEGGRDKVDGFFVPVTDDKPEPWKSLQSAVSAASRRYGEKTGEKTFTKKDGTPGKRDVYSYGRKFGLSKGEHEGKPGAWVTRDK
jgi:hypothetical protein